MIGCYNLVDFDILEIQASPCLIVGCCLCQDLNRMRESSINAHKGRLGWREAIASACGEQLRIRKEALPSKHNSPQHGWRVGQTRNSGTPIIPRASAVTIFELSWLPFMLVVGVLECGFDWNIENVDVGERYSARRRADPKPFSFFSLLHHAATGSHAALLVCCPPLTSCPALVPTTSDNFYCAKRRQSSARLLTSFCASASLKHLDL